MQATIKTDRSGTELRVTTFHVASAAEAKRMAKKIWDHQTRETITGSDHAARKVRGGTPTPHKFTPSN